MATQPIGVPGGAPTPDGLLRSGTDRSQESQKLGSSSASVADDARARPEAAAGSGEKLQISQKARELLRMSELMTHARNKLDSEPDVRADKVQEVKQRLKAGVYETRAIRDELAHRLSSILGDLPAIEGDER